MATLGGWWHSRIDALDGERVLGSCSANRGFSDDAIAVGGKLIWTDRRLVFLPHVLARAAGAGAWAVPREQVIAVGTQAEWSSDTSDEPAVWLRVDTDDDVALFAVSELDVIAEQIREAGGAWGEFSA